MTRPSAALRRRVRERARGRCEYCVVDEAYRFSFHQIDHAIPGKHGGATVEENLALCCALCNRRKGSDLSSIDPETRRPAMLFNPRRDRWTDHFRLDGARIVGLTPTGRTTAALLQFNETERILERAALIQSGLYEPPTA